VATEKFNSFVNTSQSDIRTLQEQELNILNRRYLKMRRKTEHSDMMTKIITLNDVSERITSFLDPKE